ncbi:MAG: L-seryl-tRNA(Sec) selenium transferase [Saprospiraceae bacterium]|nr:L-seryl-tRNA(Sec) selenium transferase [Pyrinomonadaceae bacterium]
MIDPDNIKNSAVLQRLPSIDEILGTDELIKIGSEIGKAGSASFARTAVESLRRELQSEMASDDNGHEERSRAKLLARAIEKIRTNFLTERNSRLQKVINATGVIIHTNLGRAPLSDDAKDAVLREASGYCTLEYDIETGKRGRRGALAEKLLAEITGAESAVIVNNCAAAAFLVLKVFASGKEVIVSRGELVEIGGDFRVPDVLAQSGAILREVGTTNRTRLSDYRTAVNGDTGIILKVHPSNYKIIGFTEKPGIGELAELAHQKGIMLYEDAGSGAIFGLDDYGLNDESVIGRSISAGADIVSFSGDKLLGGPQAGLIVGRSDLIEQIRKHPLYRALRVDKLIYAALEATLYSYRRDTAFKDIPVLRMISASLENLTERTNAFAQQLHQGLNANADLKIEVAPGSSVVGGGAAPIVERATRLLTLVHRKLSAGELEHRLRSAEIPVITRIVDDKVLIDLRTVSEGEECELRDILMNIG